MVNLLRHINEIMNKKHKGVMMIAEESTAWPHVTGEASEESLGFTYKWNMGWMNDFLNYMKLDPLFRKGNHNALTFSMIYQYTEDFVLVLSHDEVTHGKGSMIQKMYGDYDQKFANLRVAYGYMMTHRVRSYCLWDRILHSLMSGMRKKAFNGICRKNTSLIENYRSL